MAATFTPVDLSDRPMTDALDLGVLSIGAAGVIFTQDVTNYRSVAIQVTANSGNTITAEVSNDNTSWAVALLQNTTNNGTAAALASSAAAAGTVYYLQTLARFFRVRVSTFVSGTTSVQAVFRKDAIAPIGVNVGGSVSPTASSASLTNTTARVLSAATTNATSVKNAAGNLYNIVLTNSSAAAKFFKLYDKATAPTVGTDTPKSTLVIPANGQLIVSNVIPDRFGTGIAYAITGAVADADATAVAANDVTGHITYA